MRTTAEAVYCYKLTISHFKRNTILTMYCKCTQCLSNMQILFQQDGSFFCQFVIFLYICKLMLMIDKQLNT